MDELRNNSQIIRLLETLEENGMHKEKGEVSALVSYIGDMEIPYLKCLQKCRKCVKKLI